MKPFQLSTRVREYVSFADFSAENSLTEKDLILTNAYIYNPTIANLGLPCQTLFQEEYGLGEPTDVMVNAILDTLSKCDYDRIIAVGGGTIIDIAKVLAVAKSGDDVDALYDNVADLKTIHPMFIVPTTCGTGSEVTSISIINRITKGVKQGLVGPALFPEEAALIPELLTSLPYSVFATSSIDAMIHAVESYLSPNCCAISQMFSEEALRVIMQGWKATVAGGQETWKDFGVEFLRASNYAGIAFGYAGCAAVHALSYPLGSVYHIPHGQANQLMFADVMQKYREKKPVGKLNQLEALLAAELDVAPNQALDALYVLMDGILKKGPLHEHGVKESDLSTFAKNVVETQQRLLGNNYVLLSEADILDVYRSAF